MVRSEPSEWSTNAAAATVVQDGKYGAQILHARWDGGERVPTLEVVSTVTTQDRAIDFDKPGGVTALSDAERALYTARARR